MVTIIDRQTEAQFQASVVKQLHWCLPEGAAFHASANGGERHDAVGARLVGQGVVAGSPDLEVFWEGRVIFLELKTASGVLSAVQKQRIAKLRGCGCPVYVCRSPEEVVDALTAQGVPLKHTLARS